MGMDAGEYRESGCGDGIRYDFEEFLVKGVKSKA